MRVRRFAPISTVSIVTFHHVHDIHEGYAYDPDVVDATPAQFRRHLETLARIGTPIGMDAFIGACDGGSLPPNPWMVTFDDGYRSCRDVALPILRELGIPATFFISTSFITERRLYWWERIAAVLHLARGKRAMIADPRPLRIDANDPAARRQLDDIVKDTRGLDIDRFLAGLCTALDVDWSPEIEARHADALIMTWADIRALASAGMDVESHTRYHRVLPTLDGAALRDELVGSRRELELELGRPVRAIAYPVGRQVAPWIRRVVAEAGYRVGFTNASGVNRMWPAALRAARPLDLFDMHRLSTERSMSDAMFLTQLAVPQLALRPRPRGGIK